MGFKGGLGLEPLLCTVRWERELRQGDTGSVVFLQKDGNYKLKMVE